MDEVEYKLAYNAACTAAERITAPETKHCMMQVLQILNYLNERITELQTEVEDDC